MTTPDLAAARIANPNPDVWEAAYLRFETPEQEIRKFQDRLKKLGSQTWPRDAEIVELFCGRGNGLHALNALGFTRLEGVDLSAALIAQYRGKANCHTCDCRQLPFPDGSKDILIVQGGLHHLPKLPDDLQRTVFEMKRVLRKSGRLVIVEPWLTPFLSFVHAVCENPMARRASNKLDALATMIEHERETYEQWLGQPEVIRKIVTDQFDTVRQSMAWGKWSFVGTPKSNPLSPS